VTAELKMPKQRAILKFLNVVVIDIIGVATRQVVYFDKMMAFLVLPNEFFNFINGPRQYSGESPIQF